MTVRNHSSANALRLATDLQILLRVSGERNWIRGVDQVAAMLEAGDIKAAASSYKGMLAGNGSFSDFYFPAEELGERRRLNQPLDQLRDDLWAALGL